MRECGLSDLRSTWSLHQADAKSGISKIVGQPICDVVRAKNAIITLAVLSTAVIRREYLQRFVLAPHRFVQPARIIDWHDRVMLTVDHKKGARYLIGDSSKRITLQLLHRSVHVRNAKYPQEVEMWRGYFAAARFNFAPPANPGLMIIKCRICFSLSVFIPILSLEDRCLGTPATVLPLLRVAIRRPAPDIRKFLGEPQWTHCGFMPADLINFAYIS